MKFKADQTLQKLRGGYYTPQNLADYISRWALGSGNIASILEPSCGDGVFIQALANANCRNDIQLDAHELFDVEAEKASSLCQSLGFTNYSISCGDFLSWANDKLINNENLYDAIIGNPPFIRYQFLEKKFQQNTEMVFAHLGLKFTKHTNAWVPFILASVSLLNNGGRLAMVIPSEIIHVMHAQSLRTYLAVTCKKILIIDPQELWFENTLQGAVIFMVEKKSHPNEKTQGVAILHVKGLSFLETDAETVFQEAKAVNGDTVKGKWTKALLSDEEIGLVNRLVQHEHIHNFKKIADVDVGIVTGANHFFLVNNGAVEKYQLHDYVYPMFGRSDHCKGVIYDQRQHQANVTKGLPTNFVYLDAEFSALPPIVQGYIRQGEAEALHTRYKCRIRSPWYKVPSVYARKIGMLKRAHDTPRLIFNELEAYTTDTAYRISSARFSPELLVYCFLNPLTALLAEIEGRYYGGGVLELVPSEIERLYIPIPEGLEPNIRLLDEEVRTLPMDRVLGRQGERILKPLGLTDGEVAMLVSAWQRLRDRRQRK
jgi:adenine-specific DNA methylase